MKFCIKAFFSKCDQIRKKLVKKVKLRKNKKIWKEKLSHSSYYQNYLDVLQNHGKLKIPGFTTKSDESISHMLL